MSEKNMKSESDSYIVIKNWMVSKLGLKGVELIIYAIIFGFSQDGQNCYTSSTKYLCFWTGKSKETCLNALKSLRNKNLIARRKRNVSYGPVKPTYYVCDYWATITRFPTDAQEKILNNWANFSTVFFHKPDE